MTDKCSAKTGLWWALGRTAGASCPFHNFCHMNSKDILCADCSFYQVSRCQNYDHCPDCRRRRYNENLPQKAEPEKITHSWCLARGGILAMVDRLAGCYLKHHRPSGSSFILNVSSLLDYTAIRSITIQYVRLKACHGAVWREGKGWVIFLRSADSPAEQKFTLLHELFHILFLTHNTSCQEECCTPFTELLADHFALATLVPQELLSTRGSGLPKYYLKELEKNLGVTKQALATRLGQINLAQKKPAMVNRRKIIDERGYYGKPEQGLPLT